MKAKCRSCGDAFTLTKDEQRAVEYGDGRAPDQCDECFQMMQQSIIADYDEFSDADPGL